MDKDLEQQIEEMEKEMFGTPEAEEPTEQIALTPDPSPVVVEEITTQPDPYEKRFKNYKASTDLTIRDLRSELASMKSTYANLQDLYNELQRKIQETPSAASSIFSEDDIDVLGEPAVNAINKGMNELLEKRVKPLQDEVYRNRKDAADRDRKEATRLAQDNYDRFINKLTKKVPDVEELNIERGFLEYMEGVDDDSGFPRKHLFKQAEKALDVNRIASFFKEYKDLKSPGNEVLEKAISPSGVKGGEPPSSQREKADPVITRAFIDKFYNDCHRGKYRGKDGLAEATRIERMIDQAVSEGRIEYIPQY